MWNGLILCGTLRSIDKKKGSSLESGGTRKQDVYYQFVLKAVNITRLRSFGKRKPSSARPDAPASSGAPGAPRYHFQGGPGPGRARSSLSWAVRGGRLAGSERTRHGGVGGKGDTSTALEWTAGIRAMTRRTQLEPAAEAIAAHDWERALEVLEANADDLDGDGLALLAVCARWTSNPELTADAFERAYSAFIEAGNVSGAAHAALELVQAHLDLGRPAVAASWCARAEQLLADLPEGPLHGRLAWNHARAAALRGDVDAQESAARRAHTIACEHGDRDLEALARVDLGNVAAARGKKSEALDAFDHATAPRARRGDRAVRVRNGLLQRGLGLALPGRMGSRARMDRVEYSLARAQEARLLPRDVPSAQVRGYASARSAGGG